MTFVTIVARNYLAYATVLASSIRRCHPSAEISIFVVDALRDEDVMDGPHGVQFVLPSDVIDVATFEAMAYSYDTTELCTAIKPFVLWHLLMLGHEKIIYLDPDVRLFRSLDDVDAELQSSNIVLTPHLTQPLPFDGRKPDELTMLQVGTYNLGFIGIRDSAETRRFLAWWQDRLQTMSTVNIAAGLFTDQKWINLVPGAFDGVQILRSRSLNIAYWNLFERTIDRAEPIRLATGEPIGFFHFSGFNPAEPTVLSKYQDRIEPCHEPGLLALLRIYAQELYDCGYERYRRIPYRYARFSNGVALDVFARSAYRDALKLGLRFRRPGVVGPGSLFDWLNAPLEGVDDVAPVCTNYLAKVYELRADLRSRFPYPTGPDRFHFFDWLAHSAEERDPKFGSGTEHSAAPSPAATIGVNAIGYFRAESGTGEQGRGYVKALCAAGVATQLTDVSNTTTLRCTNESLITRAGRAKRNLPIDLFLVNADQVPVVRGSLGGPAAHYSIGCWWWELPKFPEIWHDRFQFFDEIWAGSRFVAAAIGGHSPIPIYVVPPVIEAPKPPAHRTRFSFASNEFVFLFMFDFLSYFERKNPVAAIEAFQLAFRRGERVRLALKFANSDVDRVARTLLYERAATDDRITLIDAYFDREQKNELMASCDAYVSLHRSEGFGLTLAEAMILGKPVIATDWSGNVDFLNESNGFPVHYRLVAIDRDVGPYLAGGRWAEADLMEAATAMRAVVNMPAEAARRANKARADIGERFSAGAVGAIVRERIDAIAVELPTRPRTAAMQLLRR